MISTTKVRTTIVFSKLGNGTILIDYLGFDDTYDDDLLACVRTKNHTETQTSDATGSFSLDGRTFDNLDHVKFDELAKFTNGVRLMALKDADDIIPQHQELFKLRIANPVSSITD